MDEMARKLTVVRTSPGAPLAPEPHPANYWDEVPAEMHAHIDEQHPQETLGKGRILAAIEW